MNRLAALVIVLPATVTARSLSMQVRPNLRMVPGVHNETLVVTTARFIVTGASLPWRARVPEEP